MSVLEFDNSLVIGVSRNYVGLRLVMCWDDVANFNLSIFSIHKPFYLIIKGANLQVLTPV